MRKLCSKSFVGVSLLLSMFLPASMVQAQEAAPGPSTAGEQRAISDNELRSFAKAYVEFEKIRAEYGPKMGTANTPQEKGMVEQEAVIKFGRAIEKEGLTIQQYSALFQTVSVDQQLREKVLRLIEEERGRS
jgi:hypothetical protein